MGFLGCYLVFPSCNNCVRAGPHSASISSLAKSRLSAAWPNTKSVPSSGFGKRRDSGMWLASSKYGSSWWCFWWWCGAAAARRLLLPLLPWAGPPAGADAGAASGCGPWGGEWRGLPGCSPAWVSSSESSILCSPAERNLSRWWVATSLTYGEAGRGGRQTAERGGVGASSTRRLFAPTLSVLPTPLE